MNVRETKDLQTRHIPKVSQDKGHSSLSLRNIAVKFYHCGDATKNEHVNKVCCSSSERALFQHSAIAISKNHVEKKIETESSKEEEGSQHPPYLQTKGKKYI